MHTKTGHLILLMPELLGVLIYARPPKDLTQTKKGSHFHPLPHCALRHLNDFSKLELNCSLSCPLLTQLPGVFLHAVGIKQADEVRGSPFCSLVPRLPFSFKSSCLLSWLVRIIGGEGPPGTPFPHTYTHTHRSLVLGKHIPISQTRS